MSAEQSGLSAAMGQREATAVPWWRVALPSWPLLIAFAGLARALASPASLLHDPDTYLHIAAGRWMLAHHALPFADPFSHSMAGAPWVPAEWLGELGLALAYRAGGWGGVIVLSAAAFAVALGVLTWFLLRRLPALPALVASLAGAALVLPHLLARPHVLALPLLVGWCGGLLAARDEARAPPWSLLAVMVLWANVHGSFMFGLALAGFLAAEAVLWPGPGRSRRDAVRGWGGFVLAAVAAALLNPNGAAALVQPLRLVAMPALQAGFSEWRPANLAQFPALELWLLGLVALGFAGGVRAKPSRLVLVLGLVHMALAHVRHADLLGLVGPLAIAAAIGRTPLVASLAESASAMVRGAAALARPARPAARALMLALTLAVCLPVMLHPPARDGDAVTPAAALAGAARLGLAGPVFKSEAFGGYLIFFGIPTFIDGRIEMYGNEFLARDLAAERGDPAALTELLSRYHIAWTLLGAESPAAAAMDRLPGWRRVYADGQAVIDVPAGAVGD